MNFKCLIILNPHAGGGRARKQWKDIERLLREANQDFTLVVTDQPHEVEAQLTQHKHIQRVISIGGDGTNHALVNALAKQQVKPIYGMLPVGTGQDWARSRGIPFDIEAAIQWLNQNQAQPTDIGQVWLDDTSHYFLNIVSVGMGGEVDAKVQNVKNRRPWTFLRATVETILTSQPRYMQIKLDGNEWYAGEAYLAVIANGTTFGHGMKIAPHARVDDGLFDFILIEDIPRTKMLAALGTVYTGEHLKQHGVHYERAAYIQITGEEQLEIDLDGEHATAKHLNFRIQPGLLNILR